MKKKSVFVAVRIPVKWKTEVFEFPSMMRAKGFIADLPKYCQYAIGKEIKNELHRKKK